MLAATRRLAARNACTSASGFRQARTVTHKYFRTSSVQARASSEAMATAEGVPAVTEEPLMCYNWLCPYVHRVTLALGHKKLAKPIQEVPIDLRNKPEWLPKFSPHGKVPAITYMEGGKQQVLYESLVLQQWVEDYYGSQGPSLLPETAAQKAKMRIIIARFDSSVVSAFYKVMRCSSKDEIKPLWEDLHKELAWLEEQMDEKGPFMLGSSPTLADTTIAPWFLRAFVLKHFKNLDMLEGHPKLKAWTEHYKSLPEVAATYKPPAGESWDEAMIKGYAMYGGESTDMSAFV